MDTPTDYFDFDTSKVLSIKSCFTCELYYGEFEDTGNGFFVIHCSDGKSRCAVLDAGCNFYEEDVFRYVKDVQ
jgi:hypothetical protein